MCTVGAATDESSFDAVVAYGEPLDDDLLGWRCSRCDRAAG